MQLTSQSMIHIPRGGKRSPKVRRVWWTLGKVDGGIGISAGVVPGKRDGCWQDSGVMVGSRFQAEAQTPEVN